MKCLCSNEKLEIRSEKESLIIKGHEYTYDTEFYFCPECGEEWYTAEQSKADDFKRSEIQRHAMGFLSPSEISRLLKKHALTQEQAAAIFGGGKNAFSKYERAEAYPSLAMDKLLRIFDNCPDAKLQLVHNSSLTDDEKKILLSKYQISDINVPNIRRVIISKKEIHLTIPIESSANWKENEITRA